MPLSLFSFHPSSMSQLQLRSSMRAAASLPSLLLILLLGWSLLAAPAVAAPLTATLVSPLPARCTVLTD
jgi:hypothetical protein